MSLMSVQNIPTSTLHHVDSVEPEAGPKHLDKEESAAPAAEELQALSFTKAGMELLQNQSPPIIPFSLTFNFRLTLSPMPHPHSPSLSICLNLVKNLLTPFPP